MAAGPGSPQGSQGRARGRDRLPKQRRRPGSRAASRRPATPARTPNSAAWPRSDPRHLPHHITRWYGPARRRGSILGAAAARRWAGPGWARRRGTTKKAGRRLGLRWCAFRRWAAAPRRWAPSGSGPLTRRAAGGRPGSPSATFSDSSSPKSTGSSSRRCPCDPVTTWRSPPTCCLIAAARRRSSVLPAATRVALYPRVQMLSHLVRHCLPVLFPLICVLSSWKSTPRASCRASPLV